MWKVRHLSPENDILKVKVKSWLDEDDFRKTLRFADYLGRKEGYSIFRISKSKALANNLAPDDILDILDQLGFEYSPELPTYLDKLLSKLGKAVISYDGSKLAVKFDTFLGSKLHDTPLRNILKYSRKERIFLTEPYKYYELKKILSSLGFNIEDLTGFATVLELPKSIEFRGTLRDYQKEALIAWIKNDYKGVIALPTGSGKTVVAIAALANVNLRALIVAFTKEQLYQWKRALIDFTNIDEAYIGMYFSEEKRIAPITLTTYQTAFRHTNKLAPYFGLLVIDEVHHLPADKFRHIAVSLPAPRRLGLSATPYREDGKHLELFPLMGGIVYSKTPQELAELGYLASYEVVTIKVSLKPNERKKYLELRRKYRRLINGADFNEVLEAARRGDRRAIEALRIHNEIKQLVQKSEAKFDKTIKMIKDELKRGAKIIVFAHYVDLAKKIAEAVRGYLLTGETDNRRRRLILETFRSIHSGVLVVTTVGDEGLDIPDANVGILVAGTGSRRQFIQRLGRLLRPQPGKKAILYEIIVKGTSEELHSRKRKTMNLDFDSETWTAE